MSRKPRAPVQSRTRADRRDPSRELLEGIAQILVETGHSPRHLMREFSEICTQLTEPEHPHDASQITYFWDLPHVISHWHSDPQYVDSWGRPIPLRLQANGPSLSDLIERVLPNEDVQSVARSLVEIRAVTRRGAFYVSSGRFLVFPPGTGIRVHAFTALLGMLRTVAHNVSARRRLPPLLERTALSPSFPASRVQVFNRELKKEAERILWHWDEKMRSAEKTYRGGPRVRLGVGVFTFLEPADSTGMSNRSSRTKR